MSADLIEQGAPRCPECGTLLTMHHDPGCSQPCGACRRANRKRVLRDVAFILIAAVLTFLGDWLLPWNGDWRHSLTFTSGLVTGCLIMAGWRAWGSR